MRTRKIPLHFESLSARFLPLVKNLPDDPSRSIFWGHTLEEVYTKKMGTVKPEEPVSDKVSAVGLPMTGSPFQRFFLKLKVPAYDDENPR